MEKTDMRNYSSSFRGKGSEFFGVVVINWLLTVITLGLYYPWAKERTLKYLYANTYLENDRFQFSGTGKEMFVGFIKVFGMFLFLYLAFLFAAQSQNAALHDQPVQFGVCRGAGIGRPCRTGPASAGAHRYGCAPYGTG